MIVISERDREKMQAQLNKKVVYRTGVDTLSFADIIDIANFLRNNDYI